MEITSHYVYLTSYVGKTTLSFLKLTTLVIEENLFLTKVRWFKITVKVITIETISVEQKKTDIFVQGWMDH